MATQFRTVQFSFAGGLVSPEAQGRIDLDKYQTGLTECENFVVKPHGAAENRAGLAYVNRVKDSTKRVVLVPFSYSTTQHAMIEFGAGYFRFHFAGDTLLESTQTITDVSLTDPCSVEIVGHGYSNGDWVHLSGIGGTTELNGRYYIVTNASTDTFDLLDVNGNPVDATAYTAFTSGGTAARVYEVANTYTESQLREVQYSQNNDVVTLVHQDHPIRELQRLSTTAWSLVDVVFDTTMTPPTGVTAAATVGSGAKNYSYAVSAVAEDGVDESQVQLQAVGAAVNITGAFTAPRYYPLLSGKTHGFIQIASTVGYKVGQYVGPVTGVVGITGINDWTYKIVDIVDATTLRVVRGDGTRITSSVWSGTYSSGGQFYSGAVLNDLSTAGNYNTVSWNATDGASRYRVYKEDFASGLYGFIGETENTSFKDDNITPDTATTPPVGQNPFLDAGNYPRSVCHFEQRRLFAGTVNGPQFVWGTNSGLDNTMTASFPPGSSDAFSFRIASRQNNGILHIIPAQDLLAFTPGAVYRISSAEGALAANDVQVRLQSYTGATEVKPVLTGSAVVFVTAASQHPAALSFDWQQQSFAAEDLAVLATHLFEQRAVVSMAFQRGGTPTVWCVLDDGVLLGLTYMPDQRVVAWHKHTTNGLFEEVSVLNEDGDDTVYVAVKRGSRRNIERAPVRENTTSADCFYVDAGMIYDGAATTTITNLWPLEGDEVVALGDGAYLGEFTVQNGQITLPYACAKVHVGLAYEARMRTLPLATQSLAGYGLGATVNVRTATLRLHATRGVKVGVSDATLREPHPFREGPYTGAPPLVSDTIEVPLDGDWNDNGQVLVVQQYPLPCTVTALVLHVARL